MHEAPDAAEVKRRVEWVWVERVWMEREGEEEEETEENR
jgi:hypothetical protein